MFSFYYRPRSEPSEGYVFTGVCHSFCSTKGEVCSTKGLWTTPPSPPPGPGHNTSPPWDQVTTPPSLPRDQVTTPPSLPTPGTRSQHLPSLWTTPPSPSRQHLPPPGQHLPPPWTMRRRAVRILLECILVLYSVHIKLQLPYILYS